MELPLLSQSTILYSLISILGLMVLTLYCKLTKTLSDNKTLDSKCHMEVFQRRRLEAKLVRIRTRNDSIESEFSGFESEKCNLSPLSENSREDRRVTWAHDHLDKGNHYSIY